jgi:hypothetical protein
MPLPKIKPILITLLAAACCTWTARAATYKEVGGIVVVEGEHFDSRAGGDDEHAWKLAPDELTADEKASAAGGYQNTRGGKYMVVFPDSGQNRNNADLQAAGPSMDFKVQIATPGEYRLFVRDIGYDGAADSFYARVVELKTKQAGGDGNPAEWYRKAPTPNSANLNDLNNGLGWDGDGGPGANSGDAGGVPMTYQIDKVGTYTVRIQQREDGNCFDAFVLQLTSLPFPSPDVPESPRTDAAPGPLALFSLVPGVDAKAASFSSPVAAIFLNGTTTLDQASVKLSVDGADVKPTVTQNGDGVVVSYQPPALFLPGSKHSATLSWKDNKAAAGNKAWSFTVENYNLILPALAVKADTSKPGFSVSTFQTETGRGNSVREAEQQIAGQMKDGSGSALPNVADLSGAGPDGRFAVTDVINFNEHSPDNPVGNFTDANGYPDALPPGIPGTLGGADNYSQEILTYLDLPAGVITMGVNSDDGFITSAGIKTGDLFDRPATLGVFDGGRGSSDTTFTFVVQQAGVYPFRTLWFEGGGDSNCEWFTINNGKKVLINDSKTTGAIKAYRAVVGTIPKKIIVRTANPAPGSGGAPTTPDITIELVDGDNVLDKASVSLKLDGAAVAATVTKAGNATTVTYHQATAFPLKSTHIISLSYKDGANQITRDWTFAILNTDLLAYWDFNDASDPKSTKDRVGGYVGNFEKGAGFTADAKGRTSKAGDRAAHIGAADAGSGALDGDINVVDYSLLNPALAQNRLAVSFWQRLDETKNESQFWIDGVSQDRTFQAHVPWGGGTIYFDTAGCCGGDTRINADASTFSGYTDDTWWNGWHHFVFQKELDHKQVWIDGKVFLEGDNNGTMALQARSFHIGSDNGGGNNVHGDIDDFAVFATSLTPDEIGKLAKGDAPNTIRTATPPPPPVETLKITKIAKNADGTVTMEWTGGGTLQAAAAVTGPWADVTSAKSPYTFKPDQAATFGRIKK